MASVRAMERTNITSEKDTYFGAAVLWRKPAQTSFNGRKSGVVCNYGEMKVKAILTAANLAVLM